MVCGNAIVLVRKKEVHLWKFGCNRSLLLHVESNDSDQAGWMVILWSRRALKVHK